MNKHLINHEATVREALARLNELSGEAMTLIVVDADGRAVGTLTDGDVRRHLIAGATLDAPVADICHTAFESFIEGAVDVRKFRTLRERSIRLVPVLRKDGTVARTIDLNATRNELPVSALIMAGGKGERLRPMTLTTPKPLLPIEGKAIIDYNVEALIANGVDDIAVSTRYLAEQIEEHFAAKPYSSMIRCIREDEPLGTIGAIATIPRRHPTTLVMNSDLLTDIAFDDMYLRHVDEAADITVAAIPYSLSVPFAVLQTDGLRIVSLEEKPVYSYYANAGIYLVSDRAAALVKAGERTDATDLIERAIAEGLKVVYFPINGTWIDVGTPADFRHACDIMKYHRK